MKSIINFADKLLRKYTPDPFVIAIILSFLTVVLALVYTDSTPAQTIEAWGGGFWNLAEFTLQMSMILLGGYVVAISPPIQKVLSALIGQVKTPTQAVLFCTLAAMIASWINWGFGLVIGGVVALQVGKQLPSVSFRLLVASSYSGFLVWHAGLSGSIPLLLNTPDNFTQQWLPSTVPLSQTLFGHVNLIALGSMVILLPLLNLWMLSTVGGEHDEFKIGVADDIHSLAEDSAPWIERSWLLALLLFAMAGFYVYTLFRTDQFSLNLDSVNFIFFMAGLVLHGSPHRFMQAVREAVTEIAPILIQYPLYAAIMAVLVKTGLAAQIADWFVSISTKQTFPLMSFYSAGLINLFVPSGGGQWAVQAPIVLPAAQELGADVNKTIMAVAWGDAWTNMAQPFWAVPLLAIAGLKIKDIIGFCLITLLASGAVLSLVFLLA